MYLFPLFYSSLSSVSFIRLPLTLSIPSPVLFPTSVEVGYCIDRSNACWPLLIVIFSLGTMDELLQTSLSHNIGVTQRKMTQFAFKLCTKMVPNPPIQVLN